MQRLVTTARNIHHSFEPEKNVFETAIEAVFTVFEFEYRPTLAHVTQTEAYETLRFLMTPEHARKLSSEFAEWAKEAENRQLFLQSAIDRKEPLI